MNIILKILLKNLSVLSEEFDRKINIDKTFENIGKFEMLNIMGRNKLFSVAILMFIIFGYFLHSNITIGVLFGFILVVCIYYIFIEKEKENIKLYVNNKQGQLDFLNNILSDNNTSAVDGAMNISKYYINTDFRRTKSYLYLNPVVVEFYYSMRRNSQWSFLNYQRSLQCVNLLIFLKEQILNGLAYRKYQYKELLDLRKECLNYYQAIIITYPVSETPLTGNTVKFNESMKILQDLTQNIIDEAAKKIEEQNVVSGINTEYTPIHLSGPAPDDTKTRDYNDHFDFFT